MRNVLVVGGAGYLGGAVTDLLLTLPFNVRVYDNILYEEQYRKPVDFALGDVRDTEKLKPHLMWAHVVVWLAAIVGDGACSAHPDIAMEINARSVEWLAKNYDGPIVFPSTCSVYGANDSVLDESAAVNSLSVYGTSKLVAERALEDKLACIFRLGTLFGVADNYSRIRLDLVVNVLTAKALLLGKIDVFGGEQYRPVLHVKDAAEAIVQNLTVPHSGIFNLHAVNIRIKDLAEDLRSHFPSLKIQYTELKFQDNRNYRVTSEKAVRTFGFRPKYSIDDGIEEVKKLLMEGRIKDINHRRYSNSEYIRALVGANLYPLGPGLK